MKKDSINSYKRKKLLLFCLMVLIGISCQYLNYKNEREVAVKAFSTQNKKNQDTEKLSIKEVKYYTNVNKYSVPNEIIYTEELFKGEAEIARKGCQGTKETTVAVTYLDGEEISRKTLDTVVIEEAVPMVLHIGTKEKQLYIMPVSEYIFTSAFGPRWGTNHNGVDLAVPEGTQVYAASDGTIVQSGWNGGYGISICIEHKDGSMTRYGHLSSNDVCVGDVVSQGDVIGLSGNTGNSTGPHVHFEIIVDGIPVDPMQYFQ